MCFIIHFTQFSIGNENNHKLFTVIKTIKARTRFTSKNKYKQNEFKQENVAITTDGKKKLV